MPFIKLRMAEDSRQWHWVYTHSGTMGSDLCRSPGRAPVLRSQWGSHLWLHNDKETSVVLTLIGARWWRRGTTRWCLGLGITPSRGGATMLLWPRRRVVQHQGAMAALLDLTVELGRLCLNLVMTAARQRWQLGSFGGQNDHRGRCLYRGKHPTWYEGSPNRFYLELELRINDSC
jgi:hypothetical protein